MPDGVDEQDFTFTIEDIFTLTGHGTVVTGSVESGSIRSGELVEVFDQDRWVATTRVAIELVCRPGHPPISRPPSLGLRDVDRSLLRSGFTLRRRAGDSAGG